jgi:hypothetical protein
MRRVTRRFANRLALTGFALRARLVWGEGVGQGG